MFPLPAAGLDGLERVSIQEDFDAAGIELADQLEADLGQALGYLRAARLADLDAIRSGFGRQQGRALEGQLADGQNSRPGCEGGQTHRGHGELL